MDLTETQVSKKLQEIRESVPTQKLQDVLDWVLNVPRTHPKMFLETAATLALISEQTADVQLLERIISFFKNNLEKCDGACIEHFVFVSFIVLALENDTIDTLAGEVLDKAQENNDLSSVIAPLLKSKIVPKLKKLAEAKKYSSSFAVWRAIVRTTRLRITTSITNDVLQIATMAFKENNPEYHALAFKSWKILIEYLPPEVLRKPAYIKLVLNPLNRTYRDTDANSTLQKYIAWWQHVVSLGEDAELRFDEVVVPLLQKVFCMPSAKARQVNPTAFANPTRTIPQCAYTILIFLWFNGNAQLRQQLQQLGQPHFGMNEHAFKASCLAKHTGVLEDAMTLVVNNISQRVCVPPKDYPFLLCRVIICRITSFFENDSHDVVRLILSTVYSILQTKMDVEQTLRVFQDLTEQLPPRVMTSSQFNFWKGTFSMDECPLLTLTSFYIRHVAEICHAAGGEINRKKFKQGLKKLFDCAGKHMSVLLFTGRVMKGLQDSDIFEAETWQELSTYLKNFVEQSVQDGQIREHDPDTIASVLVFPMRNSFPLTAAVTKSWIELLNSLMKANTRANNLTTNNRQVSEICNLAFEQITKSTYDLNRLLLISQMMESLVKHCDLQLLPTPSDSTPTRRHRELDDLEPFVKCLTEIIRKGCDQLDQEKPQKAACQFYVNAVEMVHTLLRDIKSPELCKDLILQLVPEIAPILGATTDKTTLRNSSLYHVESALLTAVDHVLYALTKKSNDLPKDDSVIEVIRVVKKKLTSHWKTSINETVQELAKTFSITPEKKSPLKRGSLNAADVQQSTPPSAKSLDSASAKAVDESPPERKWTRSTPNAAALRNGSSRDKTNMKSPSVSKRKTRTTPDDEFVQITSTKKKSEIYTEHQLEKLKEQKIIPSLYEDLSRSSQGTLMGPPSRPPGMQAPVADATSPPSTPNGANAGNGKPLTRESSRKSGPQTRNSSPRKIRDESSSEDNLECAFSANSHDSSPENEDSMKKTSVEDQNRENKKPKNSDAASETNPTLTRQMNVESPAPSLDETSQRVSDRQSSVEPATENGDKPRGALKRKLARPSHSPITPRLRPKRLCNDPNKTRKVSSPAKSASELSNANGNGSVTESKAKPYAQGDARPSRQEGKKTNSDQSKTPPVKIETRQDQSTAVPGTEDPETATREISLSVPADSGELSKLSLVNRIKNCMGKQREELLKFISSPEFLQDMTTEERRSFLGAFLKNVSDYIL